MALPEQRDSAVADLRDRNADVVARMRAKRGSRPRLRRLLTPLVAASVLVALNGVAYADIPDSSSVQGCVANAAVAGQHLLTLIDTSAGGKCTSRQTAIHWPASAVGSVSASSPLFSSGGTAPNISLSGIVPTANGGTGLSDAGAAGNYLRSTGQQWASSPLQGSDVHGDITGLASGFSGALAGDVTGDQTSTTVTALRGVPVASTAPTAGQVLAFNGTSWAPAAASASSSTAPPVLCPGCYLPDAHLSGANLTEAYLSLDRAGTPSDLHAAKMDNANLTNANLTGANLTYADLTSANLNRADLSGADLSSADLTGANLGSTYLNRANLTGAKLIGADLTEIDLELTNLTYANLTGATNGTKARSLYATMWSNTTCPDGSNSATNGTSPESCFGHGF